MEVCNGVDDDCDSDTDEATCSDQNACTEDACDPVAPRCTYTPKPDTTPCDDGDACTEGDVCEAGACVGGTTVDCDDGRACTVDACVAGGGCTHDLGDGCLIDGACFAVNERKPGRFCQACRPTADREHWTPLHDVPCDDADGCTIGDRCVEGDCRPGARRDCDDGLDCTVDLCDPDTGNCLNDPTGGCLIGGVCIGVNDKNAGNTCQVCRPFSSKTSWTTLDAGPCDDGNGCTADDFCEDGQCTPGSENTCDDDLACTKDRCVPSTGECSNEVTGGCLIAGRCVARDETKADNPCQICEPSVAVDAWTELDAVECDDGNDCTFGETCAAGTCKPGETLVCNDGLDCTADSCNPETVSCRHVLVIGCLIGGGCVQPGAARAGRPCEICQPSTTSEAWTALDGAPCDDGNPCTDGDACTAGRCSGGPVRTCDDGLACTDDRCSPATGDCEHSVNAGCLIDGRCVARGAHEPERPCQRCQPAVHVARWTPVDGVRCDDGNPCTVASECQDGACMPGTSRDCDDGLACTADVCDPNEGGCSHLVVSGCVLDGRCVEAGVAHEQNACLRCTPSESAYEWTRLDGGFCDDGDACSVGDLCVSGRCEPGPAISCDDGHSCTQDRCDRGTGSCSHTVVAGCFVDGVCVVEGEFRGDQPCQQCRGGASRTTWSSTDGAGCEDGNQCTVGDECVLSSCVAGPEQDCDDGLPCTADRCRSSDGACEHEIAVGCVIAGACVAAGGRRQGNACEACLPETSRSVWSPVSGGTCDDGDRCTRQDSCDDGACVGGDPVQCLARDDCHEAGSCDPRTGICTSPSRPDGSPCSDANECTTKDECVGGVCEGVKQVVCSALDQCHAPGVCDPGTGACSHPARPTGTPCDDRDSCTRTDACELGVCVGSRPVRCLAADECHVPGICNAETGACDSPVADDGTTCDDGLICTEDDQCESGACSGSPQSCDDGRACTLDSCSEPAGGCVHQASQCECTKDSDCDNGNACDGVESCNPTSLTCDGGEPVDCSPQSDACNVGVCDPETGSCSRAPRLDGVACDDENACTRSDRCVGGSCSGLDPVECVAQSQCHQTGACDPQTGTCSAPVKPDGTGCDDGNACTATDFCVQGSCVGSGETTCDAADQCHVPGVCDPATGSCSAPRKPNGSTCDDGDACTRLDVCMNGACEGRQAVSCNAKDKCHAPGSCDPTTGLCSAPLLDDGTSCDDEDSCTRRDECQAGVCTGMEPVVCAPISQCHVAGACDPASGVCSQPRMPENSPCDDGDACTQTDTCVSGTCVGSFRIACPAENDCHLPGTCDSATGDCIPVLRADGQPCEDGDRCTLGDACLEGACVSDSRVVCADGSQCYEPGVCEPSTGECTWQRKVAGTPCDDGDPCTTSDSCYSGSCVGWEPVVCEPIDECHLAGRCDGATGLCSTPTAPDGSSCEDNLACTVGENCIAGECIVAPRDCDDGIACTRDSCSEEVGGCERDDSECECAVDADCDDGRLCNGFETCRAADRSCVPGTAMDCSHMDRACLVGQCSEERGACAHVPRQDGTACDDGNACTEEDGCRGGECAGGAARRCERLTQCHAAGICDPRTGVCSHPRLPTGSPCDDSDACTRTDSCIEGTCVGSNTVECVASSQCHEVGVCDATSGRCTDPQKPDGEPCDDGSACTEANECAGGVCIWEALVCDDGKDCTADSCSDAAGGCVFDTSPCECTSDADCDDGNPCTGSEICDLGTLSCVAGVAVDCSSLDGQCAVGSCDQANGECVSLHRPNGTPCDDEDACSRVDRCQAGTCVGEDTVQCTAPSQCHEDGQCDPQTGECSIVRRPAGTGCDDGDACTEGDECQAGACTPGTPVECAAQDQCHLAGTCDPTTGSCTNPQRNDSSPCDDGDACTTVDECTSGVCVGMARIECPAIDDCHLEGTCDPVTGACSNPRQPDGTICEDTNPCTIGDACASGSCAPGAERDCSSVAAPGPCSVGLCDLATGDCVQEVAQGCCGNGCVDEAETCDDGNASPNDGCDESCQVEGCTALRFDGDDRIDVDGRYDSTGSLDAILEDHFSIELWMRSDTFKGVLLARGDSEGGGNNQIINLFLTRDSATGRGFVSFMVRTRGFDESTVLVTTGAILTPGTWHHIHAQRQMNSKLRLFVDGELAREASESLGPVSFRDPRALHIGARFHPYDGGKIVGFLEADIREVRLWSRPLAAEEIREGMTGAFSVQAAAGLLAYWPFDEGSGEEVGDRAGTVLPAPIVHAEGTATWLQGADVCPHAPQDSWRACDASAPLGSESNPAASCRAVVEGGASTGDGVYWLDPEQTGAIRTHCDMSIDGGGWTLVMWVAGAGHPGADATALHALADRNTHAKVTDSQIRALAAGGLGQAMVTNGSTTYVLDFADAAWAGYSSSGWANQSFVSRGSDGGTAECNGHANNRGFSTYSDMAVKKPCQTTFSGPPHYMATYHTSYDDSVGGEFGVYVR